MSHGLPAEYRTPDGETEDWGTTLGYLDGLTRCGVPVVVAVRDERVGMRAYVEQTGYLERAGDWPASPGGPSCLAFRLRWPDREHVSGRVLLYESLFEGATLNTVDGDDYFGLSLGFGAFEIVVTDSNTHTPGHRPPPPKRTIEDLPTAEEVEAQWAAQASSPGTRKLIASFARMREQLVAMGVDAAGRMSEAEIAAAAGRAGHRLLEDGAITLVELSRGSPTLVEAVAAELKADPPTEPAPR